MRPADTLALSWGALRAHPVRTRLTVAAVATGVAAVLLLVTLGESARQYVIHQFGSIGSNLLIILPGKTETGGSAMFSGGATHDLTVEDAEALTRLPQIRRVMPVSVTAADASSGNRTKSVTVVGATNQFLAMRNVRLAAGRNLPALDFDQPAQACLIGASLRRELFGGVNPLGRLLRIGDYRFRVIGICAPLGQSVGMDVDNLVIVPVANVQAMIGRSGLFRIITQTGTHADLPGAQKAARAMLTRRHRTEDFTFVTQEAVMETLDEILGLLTAALSAIAAISLIVAGVGVMNVMLVTVAERTREVGLCKAVGATSGQVALLFLAESALLTCTGGVLGVVVGAGAAWLLGLLVPVMEVTTPWWAAEAALGVAFGVGLLSGMLPAVRAARLMPAAALRGGG